MTTYSTNYSFPKPDFGVANWHTDMYELIDGVDALFTTFISLVDMQGAWKNSTAYTAGQTVLDTDVSALYECDVGHTSAASGTFATDRAANPTYWTVSSYSARAIAEKWADEDEDVAVETGRFSAKHWAIKAAATVGAFGGTLIEDADSDTFVKTEASADEDKVRISTAGVERVVVDSSGLDATSLLEGGTALSALYADIAHESDTANPHSVTKTQVGLGNVTNDAQLTIANNLSDAGLVAATARNNLGLGPAAVVSSGAAGDILYYSAAATVSKLNKGTDGQVLQLASGVPTWADKSKALQTVRSILTAVSTGTTVMDYDDSIPQNTEGTQVFSVAITPKSATSLLIIDVGVQLTSTTGTSLLIGALFVDSTANALSATGENPVSGGVSYVRMRHVLTSGSTSARTYKFRVGPTSAGTITVNGTGGARRFGGVANSYMTITEVEA